MKLHEKTYVPEERASRYGPGIDYGAEGRVLVRSGHRHLVWRKGFTSWMGRGVQGYYPACLSVVDPWKIGSHDIGERGGRLSRRMLRERIEEIRGAMGLPDLEASDIEPGKTLVVEEVQP